jgi:hypothetical protein
MVACQAQSIAAPQAQEGCLLLSVKGNVLFSLNKSALAVWTEIERRGEGVSCSEIVDHLREYYGGAVSEARLVADVRELTEQLCERGFLTSIGPKLRIKDDVFRTIADHSDHNDAPNDALLYRPLEPSKVSRFRSLKDTHLGFIALFTYELVLRVAGFGWLCTIVEQWPVARRRAWTPEIVRQVCAGIDRARLWYPKKVLCLQHSAVVTCLLRRRGVPANMIFAARRKPFYAHAWSEVEGTVVNDEQSIRTSYSRFRRCLSSKAD